MHVFAASGLELAGAERAHDADEELEVVLMSCAQARSATRGDAKSWIALTQLAEAGEQ
jgi:hypothetical protein